MTWVIVKNLDQKIMRRYSEIGLCLQDLDIVSSSLGNTLEKIFVIT
jgi:hypothetical protein